MMEWVIIWKKGLDEHIGFVIGEVLSMGILFNITKSFTAYSAFMIVAIIGAVCSTFFLFLVKEPKLRKTNSTG